MGFSVNVDHASNFAAFSKACDSLYAAADKHITQFERASPKNLNYVPISSPQAKGSAEPFSKARTAKLTTIDNVFNALIKNNKDYVNTPEFQAIEKKWQGNTYLRDKLQVMKQTTEEAKESAALVKSKLPSKTEAAPMPEEAKESAALVKSKLPSKTEAAPMPDFFSDFPASSLDMGSLDSDKPIL